LGKKILDRIADQMDGMGKSESVPRLDGRNMVMVLAPDKRAKQSAASRDPGHNGNGSATGSGPTPAAAPASPAGTEGTPEGAAAPPEAAGAAATPQPAGDASPAQTSSEGEG
jgi:translation initiation factor IF-3